MTDREELLLARAVAAGEVLWRPGGRDRGAYAVAEVRSWPGVDGLCASVKGGAVLHLRDRPLHEFVAASPVGPRRTGLLDADGTEILEGDGVEFVSGPLGPRPGRPGLRATVEWNPRGMWSLRHADGLNPYWVASPERLRVVRGGEG